MAMVIMQFGFCGLNLMFEADDVDDLTANTITMLFFTHSVVKLIYFAVRSKQFYRTLGIWNNPNSHPLFAESNARYHQIAVKKMRILLMAVTGTTILSAMAWTTLTFLEDTTKAVVDPVTNETTYIQVTKLLPRVKLFRLLLKGGFGLRFSFIFGKVVSYIKYWPKVF